MDLRNPFPWTPTLGGNWPIASATPFITTPSSGYSATNSAFPFPLNLVWRPRRSNTARWPRADVFPISMHGEGSLALAFAIMLGAFVSEDGATITAATLTATATLDPKIAFFSAFAGLWFGDLGVYALARLGGPALLRREWFQKWFAAPVSDSAISVNDGRLGLAVTRFFPGTRLPAYLSAGFRRMPA